MCIRWVINWSDGGVNSFCIVQKEYERDMFIVWYIYIYIYNVKLLGRLEKLSLLFVLYREGF